MYHQSIAVFLFLVFTGTSASAQDFSAYIKKNAVSLDDGTSHRDSVYSLLNKFRLIMMGEMHGTDEPANFVTELAGLFSGRGDSVQVGLEIPSGLMTAFLEERSSNAVFSSGFFTRQPLDGRENYAWAELISEANKMKNVRLFFFDIDPTDYVVSNNRDSLMYLKLKKQIQSHPKHRTILLCGNVHNMLVPLNTFSTMAVYLLNDKELNMSENICSIHHAYKSGSMINNGGQGLELRKLFSRDTLFSASVNFGSYLLLLPKGRAERYHTVFFTRSITAAILVQPPYMLTAKARDSVARELIVISEADQKYRDQMQEVQSKYGGDSKEMKALIAEMKKTDSINLVKVSHILYRYGWLGPDDIGEAGNTTLFMVIQHARLKTQQKFLPVMRQAVKNGKAKARHLALLEDRVALSAGKKQIYGSQVIWNMKTGSYYVAPLHDPDHVDERRAEVGLPPLAQYLDEVKLIWNVERYKKDLPAIEKEFFKK